jgi:hypothetical protein
LILAVEAIIITNGDDAPDLKKFLSEIYKGNVKFSLEVQKGHMGTAEALLKIKDKIKVGQLSTTPSSVSLLTCMLVGFYCCKWRLDTPGELYPQFGRHSQGKRRCW